MTIVKVVVVDIVVSKVPVNEKVYVPIFVISEVDTETYSGEEEKVKTVVSIVAPA
jgi:hypothetical protein